MKMEKFSVLCFALIFGFSYSFVVDFDSIYEKQNANASLPLVMWHGMGKLGR